MIIDGHAHITKEDYGCSSLLLEQLKEAKIDKAVLVPGGMMDVRKITRYIIGKEKITPIKPPNYIVEKLIKEQPDKFYGFYCVNPNEGEKVIEELKNAVDNGFIGLKLAPQVHNFSLTSNVVLKLAELCGELNIPFYTHVVFSPAASTQKVGYLAKTFPKTKFILGHMGFGPADIDAIDFAKQNENMFLETSQGSYLILKQALEKLGSKKLIFGSEFPMYHPHVSLDNIFRLKCSEDERDDILYKNILNIIEH